MSDSVDRVFVHALNTVKKIPRTGTARPPAAERLKLYGLYKQSMEGDVEGIMDRPIGDAPDVQAEREKWDAWYSQRGSSRTEAKRRYITTLINTMHLYASQTAEARELVAELEFVWDQIKYNAASSSTTSSSSPIQATRTLPSVSVSAAASAPRRYGSIDDRMTRSPAVDVEDQDEDLAIYRRRSGDSRLRVLSPVSQSDEAEVRSHRHANEDHDDDDDDDEDDEDDDDDEDDFQEARTGTSFSDTSHHDANIEHQDDTNHRTRKKRKRRPSQTKDWQHRIEQALTKMTTEIAALREQLDSLPITHHSHHSHPFRKPSSFFAWLLSWGKWFLFHTLRQLLWQSIILSVTLIYLRTRGDTRLERRVITILLQLRRRMMNAIQSVPRRLPKLLHLPLL